MNAIIRFKLALTSENPTILPYKEAAWARLSDVKEIPLSCSISILKGLHARWTSINKSMQASDFERTFFHPEHDKVYRLDHALGMYSWHGRHHLEHIKIALKET